MLLKWPLVNQVFLISPEGVSNITRRWLGYISYQCKVCTKSICSLLIWSKVMSSYLIRRDQLPQNQLYKILLIRYLMLFIFSWKTGFTFWKKVWTDRNIYKIMNIAYCWFTKYLLSLLSLSLCNDKVPVDNFYKTNIE